MNQLQYLSIYNYFKKRINKVYCRNVWVSYPSNLSLMKGYGKFIPFNIGFLKKKLKYKKWIAQSLGVCYEHSSNILLGLKLQDKCVIGKLNSCNNPNFYHAWNEFLFNEQWYVYDCADNRIYTKEKYYEDKKPTIIKNWTLKDILNRYKNTLKEGEKFDTLYPQNYVENNIEEINVNRISPISQHSLYKDSIIKLNKKGEVISAEVKGYEIG